MPELLDQYMTLEALNVLIAVIFVDLVLAGDNAIIVGMVAARVPQNMRRKVILWGIGAAVVMRIVFSLITVQLLSIPGIKIIGGLLLLWVCWRLWQDLRSDENHLEDVGDEGQLTALRPAIIQIVIADLSMSIDNVLAIAGLSRDFPIILVFGLVLSVAFMIFAATLIAKLLKRYPWIAYVGLVLIFYIAVVMMYEGIVDVLPTTAA
ncbi:MAG: TerC family protein [Granulosicoccus sp.]|nr:TerC family protein [Granulosicoccus sp.]